MEMLGPIVGHVTTTTARLWLRAPDVVALEWRTGPGDWERRTATPIAGRQITVVDLDGLAPATEIQYRFLGAHGEIEGAVGRFTTLGANPNKISFAFGSCHRGRDGGGPEDGFERWSALADAMWSHDFLILCGDQIYDYGLWPPPPTFEAARAAWERQYEAAWSDPRFRQVTAFSPTYMIWDDHDIRDDWGSRPNDWTGADEKRAFAAAEDTYQSFQNAHNPPGDRGPRRYGFRVGAAAFFVFDLRGERGKDPAFPVLGREQLEELLAFMAGPGAGAELLFVVTSVPVAHVSQWAVDLVRAQHKEYDIDTVDSWNDQRNQPDLLRLLGALFDLQCRGAVRQVFVLGGDVHVATACQIRSGHPEHARKPIIHQFTSSPLSNEAPDWAKALLSGLFIQGTQHLAEQYSATNHGYLARRNFGEVKMRREGNGWVVEFSVNAEGGAKIPWATVRC